MAVVFITCPVCKQKLALQEYMTIKTELVCANLNCEANLRIVQRKPLRVELISFEETLNVNDRPESYG